MTHRTTAAFWRRYRELPEHVQRLAQKNYRLLEADPYYPSLHFKEVKDGLWSVRVGRSFRALALKKPSGFFWFWIGPHDEYDRLLS